MMKIETYKHCYVVRGFFSPELQGKIKTMANKIEETKVYRTDNPKRHSLINYPSLMKVHRFIQNDIENIVNEKLKPSYTYYSNYLPGADLVEHKDRQLRYLTVTYRLSHHKHSPFYIEGKPYILDENDAIIFKGQELAHYRESNPYTCCMLLFHFVKPEYQGPLTPASSENYQ